MTNQILDECNPKTIRKLRAIIYLRVSTDEQAETGRGLRNQIRQILRYVQELRTKGYDVELVGDACIDANTGLKVIQSEDGSWVFANPERAAQLLKGEVQKPIEPIPGYQDDFTGAVPIDERPEGQRAYALLANDQADALVVFSVDRLVRPPEEGDEWQITMLIRSLTKLKKEIHTTKRGKIGTSFVDMLLAVMDAKAAGEERRVFAERSSNGRDDKARDNKLVLSGPPPFGCRREGVGKSATWVPDEVDMTTVKQAFELFHFGDRTNGCHPLSLRAICFQFDRDHVARPHSKSIMAKCWRPGTIRGILKNEIYIGRTYYGRTRHVDGKNVLQPRDKWIPIEVPQLAVIDPEVFYAVQERLKGNRVFSQRNAKREYLLSSFGRCGGCHSSMTGVAGVTHYKDKEYLSRGYRCMNPFYRREDDPCPNRGRHFNASDVENAVWEWVTGFLKDEQTLVAGLRRMAERRKSETAPLEERLKGVNDLLNVSEKRIARLAKAISGQDDETILAVFQTELDAIKGQRQSLQDEKKRLAAKIAGIDLTPDMEQRILVQAGKIRAHLDNPTFQQKRQLLRDLRLLVVFNRDEQDNRWLEVSCELGVQPEKIVLRSS